MDLDQSLADENNLGDVGDASLPRISGPPDAGYYLEGFVDRQGQICALLGRRRLRMYPPGLGNSSFTVSIPLEQIAADSLRDLLRAVRYRGIFSAEFKRDARDGQFKLLEVNARVLVVRGIRRALRREHVPHGIPGRTRAAGRTRYEL